MCKDGSCEVYVDCAFCAIYDDVPIVYKDGAEVIRRLSALDSVANLHADIECLVHEDGHQPFGGFNAMHIDLDKVRIEGTKITFVVESDEPPLPSPPKVFQ